jgi:hypothetical protein
MSTLVNDGTPGDGIEGLTSNQRRNGVIGRNVSTKPRIGAGGKPAGNGVFGVTQVPNGAGVSGVNNNGGVGVAGAAGGGDRSAIGVEGTADGSGAIGVSGEAVGFSAVGVLGTSDTGIQGNGATVGVAGFSSQKGIGVNGEGGIGIFGKGEANGVFGIGGFRGVIGKIDKTIGDPSDTDRMAGEFDGPVFVNGTLLKAGGGFKIDHPLDSANKYLAHSFVESPDMKNVYDGVVVLNAKGEALVRLPPWFEALNRDFRHQLTAIGAPGPNLHIAQEISKNSFKIAGGKPKMKVSWQVTGIRKDAWAECNRLVVEEKKPIKQRGYYLHAEAHGQPEELGIICVRHPDLMREMKEATERMKKKASVKGSKGRR